MTETANKGTFQPDSDVHITYKDQQEINKFARLNAKLEEHKQKLKYKENNLKSIEEALDDIALFDDDEQIPYLVGEVFIYQDTETTVKCLEQDKKSLEADINDEKEKLDEIRKTMSDLKAHLYGKFGSHINLEADEE